METKTIRKNTFLPWTGATFSTSPKANGEHWLYSFASSLFPGSYCFGQTRNGCLSKRRQMPIEQKADKHRAKDGSSPEKIHPKGEKISSGKNPDLIRIKPRIPLKIKVLPLQVTTPTLQARRGKDIPHTPGRKSTRREPSSSSTPPTLRS